MDLPESPPALHEMLVLRGLELSLKPLRFSRDFQVALDLVFQRFHQTGHSDDDRDALPLDDLQDFGRVERVLENDGRGQQLRQEDAEDLAEDVAEWQKIQKAKRVKDALVAQVFADFVFERRQVGENVAVRNDDAARFGSCARGENDLHDVVASRAAAE